MIEDIEDIETERRLCETKRQVQPFTFEYHIFHDIDRESATSATVNPR
jgi:hypothetical protein